MRHTTSIETAWLESVAAPGGDSWVPAAQTGPSSGTLFVKHALDRVIAAALVLLTFPALVIIAAGIFLTSGRPIFFKQRRVGRGGRTFQMLKFRSLRCSSETPDNHPLPFDTGPGASHAGNEAGRVGVFLRESSLDELPQLINVLRGEMSLVGPRPERPAFAAQFTADIPGYALRHRVKGGITGLAQIDGFRGPTSLRTRIRLDNAYIDEWSLALDMRILLRTLAVVSRGVGGSLRAAMRLLPEAPEAAGDRLGSRI